MDSAYREWRHAPFPEGSSVEELGELHADMALVDEWLIQIVIPYMEYRVINPHVVDLERSVAELESRLGTLTPSVLESDEPAAARLRNYLGLMMRAVVEFGANTSRIPGSMTEPRPYEGDIAAELEVAMSLVPHLTTEHREWVRGSMVGGEWELALDTLCTQINESDLEVSRTARRYLVWLGDNLGVPVEYLLGNPWAEKPDTPWY